MKLRGEVAWIVNLTSLSVCTFHPEVIELNTFHGVCDAETFRDTDRKGCCDKRHLRYNIFSFFFHWDQFVEYFRSIATHLSFSGSVNILFIWVLNYLQQRLLCCGRQERYRWDYCNWRQNNHLFA